MIPILFLLFIYHPAVPYFGIRATKRAVICCGRVIAPPTTTAYVPNSSALASIAWGVWQWDAS